MPVQGDLPASTGIVRVAVERILRDPTQPRKTFDEAKLRELAESIRTQGVIQPILVRRDGADYRLIAGERRWRAAQLAGLHEVPAVVRDVTAAEAFELALVENLQRTDLNPLEEAEGYRRLIQEFGLTQEQVGERVGRDRTSVANALRLLQLPEGVKELLATGALGMGHARALLGMGAGAELVTAAQRIVREQLSVRETERLVRTSARPIELPQRVVPRAALPHARWWRTFSAGWGRRCDSRTEAGRARWRSTSSRTRTWSVFSRCCGGEAAALREPAPPLAARASSRALPPGQG